MPSDQKWLGQLAVLCEAITSDPDAALVKQDHEEPLIKQLQAMADGATSSTRKSMIFLGSSARTRLLTQPLIAWLMGEEESSTFSPLLSFLEFLQERKTSLCAAPRSE